MINSLPNSKILHSTKFKLSADNQINVINSLPNDKIWDVTKLKAFADDKLYIGKMTISFYDRVREKTLWEREKILVTSIFSFSHSFFQSLLL